jgi:hypothetical protein
MKKLILKTERLNNLDTELIGNGGNSRLDIMLDLETGEVWADVFYDHEANSWARYEDKNIVCVGRARNAILKDDETGEADPDGRCFWNVTIWGPYDVAHWRDEVYITGDYYNNSYDVDDVLDAITQLYFAGDNSVKKMFEEYAKKFGLVVWDGVELAITQDPYPDGPFEDACFRAAAMDRAGNRWQVRWDILPGVDSNTDYSEQCDWDSPSYAEMTDEDYYLDD